MKLRNSLNTLNAVHLRRLEAEIGQLNLQLHNSVSRADHEAMLGEFRQKAQQTLVTLSTQAEGMAVQVSDETEEIVQYLSGQIKALESQLKNALKPINFDPATRYDHQMGNLIIAYFWRLGILLDRAHTEYRVWESIVCFHTERSGRFIVADELNDHAERLQTLLKCLNVPKFEWEAALGLMKVRLQVATKPKEGVTQQDASKIWKAASQLEELVKGWRRVRITGGSGSGKSPTAENVAIAILLHHPGKVKLANPMHVSTKNHWSIPVSWTSHEGSCEGVKELVQRVENRAQGHEPQDEFILYIFDEIDTTMAEHRDIVPTLMSTFKQSSHQNLGIISTGQNANASNYKGSDRSEMGWGQPTSDPHHC